MAEQGNIGIGDIIVANVTVATVPQVVFRQKVLFIDILLGAIDRGMFLRTPLLRQEKSIVGIGDFINSGLELIAIDMSLMNVLLFIAIPKNSGVLRPHKLQ